MLDLGVLRLSIAGLDQKSAQMTTPFAGFQLGASARLFDLQLLPTTKLKSLLPDDQAKNLPSSLAQLSLGEQVARAYAPTGGVVCGTVDDAARGRPGTEGADEEPRLHRRRLRHGAAVLDGHGDAAARRGHGGRDAGRTPAPARRRGGAKAVQTVTRPRE